MKPSHISIALLVVSFLFAPALFAQAPASESPSVAGEASAAEVPHLIKFNGSLLDEQGHALAGPVGVTFALYAQQTGGATLWLETQNVEPDGNGNYTVLLGANSARGLPAELFTSAEARWLGIQVEHQPEQPRVLLVSVPYALKARDADTLGGLPASAFLQASAPSNPSVSAIVSGPMAAVTSGTISPAVTKNVTTTGGEADYLPVFSGASTLIDSVVYQSGTGATAKVGINTTSPAATLDVRGSAKVEGPLTLPATGAATKATGENSQPQEFVASSYDSTTKAAVNQTFEWQAEAASNDTTTPSGTLNLLFGSGTTAPAETGLKVNNKGVFTFAKGQAFPGTGPGTVKGVGLTAPDTDFTVTGSPVNSTGTLDLAWNVTPTFINTANAIVKRDSTGSFYAFDITAVDRVYAVNEVVASGNLIAGENLTAKNAFVQTVGIGTLTPQAELNLNQGGNANNDTLLIGNNSTKGLQLRDNGTGVDLESIGVPLYVNYITQEPVFLNPNGGLVYIGEHSNVGLPSALNVGAFVDSYGDFLSASFSNDVLIYGNLYAYGTKDFRIDHPLDPMNKYLYHAAIESSEVLNQYSGNVILDGNGEGRVEFPAWFAAINEDFRYQLTAIGAPGPNLYISEEIVDKSFTIAGGKPGMKVSWQVTARRNDAYMKAHPYAAERDKSAGERGHYTHPELYGAPKEKGIWSAQQSAAKDR